MLRETSLKTYLGR